MRFGVKVLTIILNSKSQIKLVFNQNFLNKYLFSNKKNNYKILYILKIFIPNNKIWLQEK